MSTVVRAGCSGADWSAIAVLLTATTVLIVVVQPTVVLIMSAVVMTDCNSVDCISAD